jgi:DNA-binding response OmpR family regulator
MARILIVDDDPDVVEACRLFLEKEKHQVSAAHNRADGMKAVRTEKPDLLILDVIMEEADDGIAMAQELRREKFSAPILMLTSLAKVTGMSYGADKDLVPVDAFIEKPVDPAVLLRKVAELLKGKEG